MFGETNEFEHSIRLLLEEFSLEDIFDMVNISSEEALFILFSEGHAEVPDWCLKSMDTEDNTGDF